VSSIPVFVVAAFLEIAGCFAFWLWLRRGMSFAVALLGLGSLAGFAFALTRVDSAFAGRAYPDFRSSRVSSTESPLNSTITPVGLHHKTGVIG
jgi:small multidrug resistance family-3 protein